MCSSVKSWILHFFIVQSSFEQARVGSFQRFHSIRSYLRCCSKLPRTLFFLLVVLLFYVIDAYTKHSGDKSVCKHSGDKSV